MSTLEQTLALVPAVYARLGDALTPGRGTGEGNTPDPRHKPAPARLDAVEHRHLLLRGLRWWVDAVDDGERRIVPVGASPARMCAFLLWSAPRMAAEDRAELHGQLTEWLAKAWPLVGDVPTPRPRLPLEALTRRVPVHVAAEALGVSVSTVKRRTERTDGTVVLKDAAGPLCDQSWLPEAWCEHCRPDTVRA